MQPRQIFLERHLLSLGPLTLNYRAHFVAERIMLEDSDELLHGDLPDLLPTPSANN